MRPDARRRWVEIAPWAGLAALATLLSVQDIRSLDYWWHLRAGQLIVDTGEVPRVDPFTYTVPGARWIDIHWLYQVFVHALFDLGGHAAVVGSQGVLVVLWLAALAPIGYRRERAWLSAGALGLMLLVAASRLQARPELPSFVLLAWVLRLLDRFERKPDALVYAIVPLQIVWVNVHGLFAVGMAVCAIHLATEMLHALGRRGEGSSATRARRLAAVLGLAVLGSLANPNGLDGALYPLQQLDMVSSADRRGIFGSAIDELRPTFDALGPLPLALFTALAGLSLASLAANWRRVREADLLIWVAFFYLALGAVRNAALFAVVAAPILVRNANEVFTAGRTTARPGRVGALLATALLLAVAIDAARGRWFARTGVASAPGLGVAEGLNPIGAAEWIARTRVAAPIAHDMGDGGYLIWRLWPDYAVMSDGRLEIFGGERLLELQPTDLEGITALDARYRFGCVLLNHRRGQVGELVRALRASRRWRLAYADDVSVAFVRADADAARWPALDLDAPDLFEPLGGESPATAGRRYVARSRLLFDLGRPDLALRVWEDALAQIPDLPEGQAILADLRALEAGTALPGEGSLAAPRR